MSDAWKQWEGQIIDGKFALRQFLASTDHSAVFLTDRGEPSQKLAIKFIQLDEPLAELQLVRWKAAANLSHPNLLHLYESGRCRLGEFDLLYVLMEFAGENLSEFLPQRPLTPAETRDVLTPSLKALAFLHSESLVHGRIKPSNVLAIDDELKLSTDTVFSIAEGSDEALPATPLRPASPYDAPESASAGFDPASDIWSLGMTLVETLTQQLPAFDPASRLDPIVPDTLPAVYLDIARHCLQRDPVKRWSVVEVSARLNPGSVAPAAALATVVSTPIAAPPPVPRPQEAEPVASKVERSRPVAPANPASIHTQTVAVRSATRRYDMSPPKLERPPLLGKLPKFNYSPLVVLAVLAVVGMILGPRLLRHSSPVEHADSAQPQLAPPAKNSSVPLTAKNSPKPNNKIETARTPSPAPKQKQAPAQSQLEPSAGTVKRASNTQPVTAAPKPSISNTATNSEKPKASPAIGFQNGEVLNQVLPDVSGKARATIRGTVRVGIKLYVDAAGNVVGSEVASAGPSPFFAEQARIAAGKWDFAPAKADGHAVNSEWLVRFEFKTSDTHAVAKQTAP